MKTRSLPPLWLIIGDIAALLVITAIGFLSHNQTLDWRILTTFIPFLLSWVLVAPWLGVYKPEVANNIRQVWRPALAAVLAAPMAAWFRGILLDNRAILPVFVAVLAATGAAGYLAWRILWALLVKRFVSYG